MLNCTIDINHVEQLSLTLRFVNIYEEAVEVREYFIAYKPVSDYFLNAIVQECDLNMNGCRGQGYDDEHSRNKQHRCSNTNS